VQCDIKTRNNNDSIVYQFINGVLMYLKSNLQFFIGVAVGAIVVAGTFIGKPLKAATGVELTL
jgi:hypothetical protein